MGRFKGPLSLSIHKNSACFPTSLFFGAVLRNGKVTEFLGLTRYFLLKFFAAPDAKHAEN
jgi:hypothetical protein